MSESKTYMMVGQMVTIHSTEELPTIYDGRKGQIYLVAKGKYSGFYTVLVWNGEICVFDESQLKPLV